MGHSTCLGAGQHSWASTEPGKRAKIVSFHQAETAGSEGRTGPSWECVCSDWEAREM